MSLGVNSDPRFLISLPILSNQYFFAAVNFAVFLLYILLLQRDMRTDPAGLKASNFT